MFVKFDSGYKPHDDKAHKADDISREAGLRSRVERLEANFASLLSHVRYGTPITWESMQAQKGAMGRDGE